jgi:hypothetical protein
VGKAVSAIVPSEEKAEPRQPLRRESGRRQQGDVFRPGGWASRAHVACQWAHWGLAGAAGPWLGPER